LHDHGSPPRPPHRGLRASPAETCVPSTTKKRRNKNHLPKKSPYTAERQDKIAVPATFITLFFPQCHGLERFAFSLPSYSHMQPYGHFASLNATALGILRLGAAFRPHFVANKKFSNFWSIGQQQRKSIHSSHRGAANKNCSFFNTASISQQRISSSTRSASSVAQQETAKMSEITHPTIKGKSLHVAVAKNMPSFFFFVFFTCLFRKEAAAVL
jgi:hypothetical protein